MTTIGYLDRVARKPAAKVIPQVFEDLALRGLLTNRLAETLKPDQLLFCEGDPADCVFEVIEGTLRLYKMMPDGRRAITGFLFPGEVLGVLVKDRYLYSAEAVTRVRLQRYQRSQLHSLLARAPNLGRTLLAMACDELSAAQDQMLLLARKCAAERIASFLIAVARRLSPDGRPVSEIELPMTRLDIADYLGLTIETVSRVLTKFKTEGLIALPSPHRVVFNCAADLLTMAGEESPIRLPASARVRAVQSAVWPN
jgi:CRP/FNR family transcriptional regulator